MSYSVFIVEDDPMVADINRRLVEQFGSFKVIGISSAENDATEKIFRLRPDLVLLDIYLSGGSGINILKKIRQSELSTDVILVTAAKDVSTVYSSLRYGAIDYIIKPFNLKRLSAALNTYAQMRQLLQKKTEVKQDDLDRISHKDVALEGKNTAAAELPKGINQQTLEQIVTILLKAKRPQTCQEIAAAISVSKITVWRYLQYLQGIYRIQCSLTYGSFGRPTKKYFIAGQ